MENNEQTFAQLGIENTLIEQLAKINILNPTAVQQKIIPEILAKKSVFFQSETGTGKTFAFLLPIIQQLQQEVLNPEVIILSPTHELSSQTKSEIAKLTSIKTILCIGGSPLKRQIETLKTKPKIILGSSNRIIELIKLKKIKTDKIRFLVLDEIDRLIAPEVRDETTELISLLNADIQLIGCSATIKTSMIKIFENAFSEKRTDKTIDFIELPLEDILRKKIEHWAFYAETRDKIDTLRSILSIITPQKALIFTSKTDQVENIVSKLQYKKIDCEGIFSKTDKILRKSILDRFRSGKIKILVTSDLTARGLDIQGVTHVIQMDFPSNEDFFIHRAGRTGRAGLNGFNIVIGDSYEMRKYANLEKKLGIIVNPKELHSGKIVKPEEFESAN